jgi:hypothetical protein
MGKKEKVVEKTTNEQNVEDLEIQTTFNEDGIDVLVEDGIVENLEEVVENANVVLETTGGIGEEITIDENTIELVEDGEIDENND